MSDYIPRFAPGQAVTYTAAADLVGGQLVELTDDRTVNAASAASTKVVGVIGPDTAKDALGVVYSIPGHVHWVKASGAINAGDAVQAGAAGTVVAGTTAPFGIALKAAASGELAEFLGQ